MKVAMISCWYAGTVYGLYTRNLKTAIEQNLDTEVTGITSKCVCYTGPRSLLDDSFEFVRLKYYGEPNIVRTLANRQGTSFLRSGHWFVACEPRNGTLFDVAPRPTYNTGLSACLGPPRVPGS